MSTHAHTPGPWTRHPFSDFTRGSVPATDTHPAFDSIDIVIGAGDAILGRVEWNDAPDAGYPKVPTVAEMQANANLIMAAPDLLRALNLLMDCLMERRSPTVEEVQVAARALAKAEGQDY